MYAEILIEYNNKTIDKTTIIISVGHAEYAGEFP